MITCLNSNQRSETRKEVNNDEEEIDHNCTWCNVMYEHIGWLWTDGNKAE